jgi:hypothetical protein
LGSNTGDWVPGRGTVCRCLAGTEATETTGHAEPGEQGGNGLARRSEPDWACVCRGWNPAMRVGSVGQRWRFAGCMWCRDAKGDGNRRLMLWSDWGPIAINTTGAKEACTVSLLMAGYVRGGASSAVESSDGAQCVSGFVCVVLCCGAGRRGRMERGAEQ